MTRLITQAVFNGTKQNFAFSGMSVDKCYQKAIKDKVARKATVFLFFNRKTGKMIDVRFN